MSVSSERALESSFLTMVPAKPGQHNRSVSTVHAAMIATPSHPRTPLSAIVVEQSVCSGSDFLARVERAACGFDAKGIGAGNCIALLLRNDFAFLEATAAAQRVGAYAVPINWHGTPEEIAYVIDDCRPALLVAHADLLTPELLLALGTLEVVVVHAPAGMMAAYRATETDLPRLPNWEAFLDKSPTCSIPTRPAPPSLIYTSGTSGRPKGVRRAAPDATQFAYSDRMRRMLTQMDAESRVLIAAPLYHTAPNMFALRAVREARMLLLPWRFDPMRLLEDIEHHRITHLYAVPTMFHRLLALDANVRSRFDLSSLRFVLHAGGPCTVAIKRAMMDWLGEIVHEYYGSTDAGPLTFCTPATWLASPGTVGRAIEGVDLAILDLNGNRVPTRVEGEVCGRASGYPDFDYVGLPDARRAVQRGALVATGDIGRLDEQGNLFLTDRQIDMIVSGGVNIYPAEIEAALLEIRDVADCAVFGIADEEFGESVAAIVQRQPGATLSADDVRTQLRARIASFKVPRYVEFRESLPREDTGKIRKRLLREPFWADAGRRI